MSTLLAKARSVLADGADRVLSAYGPEIGRGIDDVPSPALLLDLPAVRRNVAHMASELHVLPAGIRPHIKVHKSPEVAKIQTDHGVIGLSVATVWEAVIMAAAGFDDILVVNTLTAPAQMDALIAIAGEKHVIVGVDDASNAAILSDGATAAGVTLGVLLEIDTGMDRAGVDTEKEALDLARVVLDSPGLALEGVSGYEGHCSGIVETQSRAALHRDAMEFFAQVTDRLVQDGIRVGIRSAGGTSTWRWTASRPEITEIQAGSYVFMDNFHGRMVPEFEKALTVTTTVISRRSDRIIVDAGNKSVGMWQLATLVGMDAPLVRFDEEHGVFEIGTSPPNLGDRLEIVPGYAPATVNMFDALHVVDDGVVVDVWPVMPRGPGHHGLAWWEG